MPFVLRSIGILLGTGLAACAGHMLDPAETIQDVMVRRIAPAAAVVWGAGGLDSTAAGTAERAPRNTREWARVRDAAIALMDGADRLAVPQRRVAVPGVVLADASFPGNLTAGGVQTVVDADWPGFVTRAKALRDAAQMARAAADARSVAQLAEAGEVVNAACAACHSAYWYPDSIQPVQ